MAELNQKTDPSLNLADLVKTPGNTRSGYDNEKKTWEIIVKYNGDIRRVAAETGAEIEVLNENYAIMTIPNEKVRQLSNYYEVEYVELPKRMGYMIEDSMSKSCIPPVWNNPEYPLKGSGVLIGIIDSGIDYTQVLSIKSPF